MHDSAPQTPAHAATMSGSRDEFYVGYLKMPPGLRRFLLRTLPGTLALSVLIGLLLGRAQRDPGDGVWNTGRPQELVGWVEALPYPHIRLPSDTAPGGVETVLLVEVGKFGGGARAAALSGRAARISGWPLTRDGRRMLEMEPGDALRADDSLSAANRARLSTATSAPLGPRTLRGEIVDSKCYLGAMKPGEGKTHKECATLCIRGGIPPMLVTAVDGRRHNYLLTDPQGGPLDARILPFVADLIEVRGQAEQRGDLLILRIDPAAIRRL